MKTQTISVNLTFTGTAEIKVPAHLSVKDARLLARTLAAARILATFDNPDGPEDSACEDYADDCSEKASGTAEKDWDATVCEGVSGTWITTE